MEDQGLQWPSICESHFRGTAATASELALIDGDMNMTGKHEAGRVEHSGQMIVAYEVAVFAQLQG